MQLNGKLVLILGLGESGMAMARWCAHRGARVRVADTRAAPPFLAQLQAHLPAAEALCGAEFDKSLLAGVDLLALSPGLSAGMLVVFHARAQGIPVVGEIELFAWALRDLGTRDAGSAQFAKVIAITGTNGKTTTTALTGHLCRHAGLDAEVAGNISPAALSALLERVRQGRLPQVWVLELSSFQLETLESLAADAATVLNISDDHLDRYIDLDDYASAKARIFGLPETLAKGVQVLNRDDARVKRMAVAGRRIVSFGLDAPGLTEDFGLREKDGQAWLAQGERFLLAQAELPLAGAHNAANALAALALCHAIDIPAERLTEGLKSFHGLAHRVEFVDEIKGVHYYDDSKGTNVGATLAALVGMGKKVVLILGGEGKGQDFSPLATGVKAHARAVVLIGRDGPLIGRSLIEADVPLLVATDMDDAVKKAAAAAQSGDVVLLSPACASFDMFKNYAHRAQVFIAAVKGLNA